MRQISDAVGSVRDDFESSRRSSRAASVGPKRLAASSMHGTSGGSVNEDESDSAHKAKTSAWNGAGESIAFRSTGPRPASIDGQQVNRGDNTMDEVFLSTGGQDMSRQSGIDESVLSPSTGTGSPPINGQNVTEEALSSTSQRDAASTADGAVRGRLLRQNARRVIDGASFC